jgi:hypothetical protein
MNTAPIGPRHRSGLGAGALFERVACGILLALSSRTGFAMSAIMTTTLRLELFFGVPLARATAGEPADLDAAFDKEADRDAFSDAILTLDTSRATTSAGFYTTLDGEVESATFFGFPVKRINLHQSAHHVEIADVIAQMDMAALQAKYEAAAAKTPFPKVLKRFGKGKPRVMAILTSSH